jgi:hypothetical protein
MLMVAAALAATPLALSAQATPCAGGVTQDACQKAVDLFQYMAPQVGTVIAGGNATLGQGGTLGGFATFPFPHPKISVGFRVNALAGSLPNLDNLTISPTGAQSSTIPVENQIIPGPAADVAIGVFKGLPLGLTNVGGVDVLLSALYLPEFDGEGVALELPDGGIKLGWGARVGLLQESLAVPGISFTWLKRGLPTANLIGSTDAVGSTELFVDDLEVNTTSWRLVASKSLIAFGIAAGVGKDKYESSASVRATSSGTTSAPIRMEQNLSRTNYFLDLSLNLFVLKMIGEVGMVQGGDVPTFNEWDGKQPADSRIYGSIGARFSF